MFINLYLFLFTCPFISSLLTIIYFLDPLYFKTWKTDYSPWSPWAHPYPTNQPWVTPCTQTKNWRHSPQWWCHSWQSTFVGDILPCTAMISATQRGVRESVRDSQPVRAMVVNWAQPVISCWTFTRNTGLSVKHELSKTQHAIIMRRVGYWITEKKSKKLNFEEFRDICRYVLGLGSEVVCGCAVNVYIRWPWTTRPPLHTPSHWDTGDWS